MNLFADEKSLIKKLADYKKIIADKFDNERL